MAQAVEPGDRVLYVGSAASRFFGATCNAEPTSRTAATVFDAHLRGQVFDLVVLSGALDVAAEHDVRLWAVEARDLLSATGRVVLDIRQFWTDLSWISIDAAGIHDLVDVTRMVDPMSLVRSFCAAGFVSRREIRHWTTNHVAHVLAPLALVSDTKDDARSLTTV